MEEGGQRENVAEKCLSKEKKEEIVERNKKKIKVYVAHVSQEEEGADTVEGGKEGSRDFCQAWCVDNADDNLPLGVICCPSAPRELFPDIVEGGEGEGGCLNDCRLPWETDSGRPRMRQYLELVQTSGNKGSLEEIEREGEAGG